MTYDAPTQRGPAAQPVPAEIGEFTASAHRVGDTHTLRLFGELDIAAADRVGDELERMEATGPRAIVIDLSGLTFMDSTGIRLMLRAHARSRRNAHDLALRRGPDAVQRVFTLCAVADLLPFVD